MEAERLPSWVVVLAKLAIVPSAEPVSMSEEPLTGETVRYSYWLVYQNKCSIQNMRA